MSPLSSVVMTSPSPLFSFEDRLLRAIEEMRMGHPVILVDDFSRENEADLVAAAETISVATMAQFIREGSGIVCLCLTEETLDRLELPQMVSSNESRHETAFTITIDARHGITTGVSARDRVATIRAAVAADAQAHDLVRPGHVFPLRAARGGVLEREGHTEGSVDLARLAGLQPAAVICEITNPDGSMTKGHEIDKFARQHNLVTLSVSELIEYRSCKNYASSVDDGSLSRADIWTLEELRVTTDLVMRSIQVE